MKKAREMEEERRGRRWSLGRKGKGGTEKDNFDPVE